MISENDTRGLIQTVNLKLLRYHVHLKSWYQGYDHDIIMNNILIL